MSNTVSYAPPRQAEAKRTPPIGWLLLLFVPFIGFISLLYMGRESGKKSWYRGGLAFGWAAYAVLLLSWLANSLLRIEMPFILWIFLYVVRVVIGAIRWRGFTKIYAFDHALIPDFLPGDKQWQWAHSLWLLWALVPFMQSMMFLQIGYRTERKKWTRMGWIFFSVNLVLLLLSSGNTTYYIDNAIYHAIRRMGGFPSIIIFDGFFLFAMQLLTSPLVLALGFYHRKEYLRAVWPGEAAARSRYAILEKKGWRAIHSLWMIMSVIPYGSGASVLFAGIRLRSKKWIARGIVLVLLPFLMMFSIRIAQTILTAGRYGIFENYIGAMSSYPSQEAYRWVNTFSQFYRNVTLQVFPMLCLTISMALRKEVLRRTAANYGGFRTQIDRELAEREIGRFQEMKAQQQEADRVLGAAAARVEAVSQPVHQPSPAYRTEPVQPVPGMRTEASRPAPAWAAELSEPAEISDSLVNINTCTQEELMKLPGVSVAMAMKAIAYREEHGGFETVDAFVDYLALKPHFAVQIFEKTTVEMPETTGGAAEDAGDDPQRPAVRRHLDL